ncbi:ABC transporter substrate-binding protein [soil metagenome]
MTGPRQMETTVHPVRRAVLAITVLVLLAGLTTACGSDSDSSSPTTSTANTPAGDAAVFPVEVEHAFGTTEVAWRPKRVVSVGVTEQDTILALGVIPVGVTEWYGEQPFATWPWAQDALGDAEPTVLSVADGFQYERIAALKPDLIIGTNAGIDEDTYPKLAAIAPTIAQPADGASAYFSAWDDQTVLIGRALGLEAEAKGMIEDVEADFAEAAADHPEFEGTKAIFLQNAFYDGEAIAYQDGLSTEFLSDLGFVVPSEITEFAESEMVQAQIPLEQLDVLNVADVLIWGTESPEDRSGLEEEPLYRALEPVEDDRLVFTDGTTAGAIYFTSLLSLPYVLDRLVPALADALGGKGPATIDS